MIDTDLWKYYIWDCLHEMADRDYQYKLWFDQIPGQMGDPVELICGLFDDSGFERHYIDSPQIGLSPEQKKAAQTFIQVYDNYAKNAKDSHIAEKVYNDPEWIKVCSAAAKLIPVLFTPDEQKRYKVALVDPSSIGSNISPK